MKRFLGFTACLLLLACSDKASTAQHLATAPPLEQSAPKQAFTGNWSVDKAKSKLSFSGDQSGETFTGSFADFDAIIQFDPTRLSDANVVVTIDMNSADANDAERTDALPGKEWFYVKKFPTAKFIAKEFKHLGGDRFEAKGNLTIKDTTNAIAFPFTLKIENGHAAMDAKLTLNRSTYKIGTGMWASEDWVGHDITINIHLEADTNK